MVGLSSLEHLEKKINVTDDLQVIIKTMKAMAATNIHQFEEAMSASESYKEVVDQSLEMLLTHFDVSSSYPSLIAQDHGRTLFIIFGSDHGLVGHFNDSIIDKLYGEQQHISNDVPMVLFCVGEQVYRHLNDRDKQAIEGFFSVPDTKDAIIDKVEEIYIKLEELREEKPNIDSVYLLYHQLVKGVQYEPVIERLLPMSIDEGMTEHKTGTVPLVPMSINHMFEKIATQYFIMTLYRALARSLASENASRLASMQAAEKNTEEHLALLRQMYQRTRQTAITEELTDIVSGFNALKRKKNHSS